MELPSNDVLMWMVLITAGIVGLIIAVSLVVAVFFMLISIFAPRRPKSQIVRHAVIISNRRAQHY
jgi:hypothetical protein